MSPKSPTKSAKKSNTTTHALAAPVTPVATSAAATAPVPTPLSSTEVANCQALLTQLDGILGNVTLLSPGDIRRSLKLRKGGAQVVTDLIDLCTHHGITAVGPATVDAMTAQKARADSLNQVGVQFDAVRKKLSDATFSAESSTWEHATALYTVLQRLALMDPALAQGIQPVQAFFQTKKTKGNRRATAEGQQLKAVQKRVAKHEVSASGATVPPPTAATAVSAPSTAPAAASNPVSPSAPVAAAPTATSGIAHS